MRASAKRLDVLRLAAVGHPEKVLALTPPGADQHERRGPAS